MTGRAERPHLRRSRLTAGLAAPALLALGLTGCSSAPTTAAGRAAAGAPSVPTPLATSLQTAGGTWATIPMGRLDEPLNTFWQLLFKRDGTSRWSDQVEATATATNGGLVLSTLGKRSLMVGVRPSVDLTFTPLISTSGSARSWSDGLITVRLAARPNALAADSAGQALALVDRADGTQVLSTTGDISEWRAVTTEQALAASAPGKSCGVGPLTAVGYLAGEAMVGASCAKAGVVGIFAQQAGAWRLVGPTLPPPLGGGRVEVLGLGRTKTGGYGLLAVVRGALTDLVAAWSGPGERWATSKPLALDGKQVASFGPARGSGLFVLLQAPSGADNLAVTDGPGGMWQELVPPPSGTATVAFGPPSPPVALVASGTTLTIWSLEPPTRSWTVNQVIHVPIQYGSSS
jgi:hypothetical protein